MLNQIKIRVWWRKKTLLHYALLPISMLYLITHWTKFHLLSRPKKIPAHVICVGNVVLGGSGKTPFCIALYQKLSKMGYKVAFISRGYGKIMKRSDVVRVTNSSYSTEVGDEALLLSKYAPTYIADDRYKAAIQAASDGAEIIIMDDGYQNNTLHKDYSFLLINNTYGLGNNLTLPAGPLREPFDCAKRRADCVVLVKPASEESLDVAADMIATVTPEHVDIAGEKFIALCAISNPDSFLKTVDALGAIVIEKRLFSDHHNYTTLELDKVFTDARKAHVKVVTTEKDAVKIPIKYHKDMLCIKIVIDFELPQNLRF